jgi:hypothetical protein
VPSHGRSGWASQTQRELSQRAQNFIFGGYSGRGCLLQGRIFDGFLTCTRGVYVSLGQLAMDQTNSEGHQFEVPDDFKRTSARSARMS